MNNLVLIFLILPFVGAIFTFVIGKIDKRLAFYSAYAITATLFMITIKLFVGNYGVIDIENNWFSIGQLVVPFGIYIDHLSLVMLLIATSLGFLDIHFSYKYMKDEQDQARYYSQMVFFVGGMMLLVSAKDLVSLFSGWEFMGVASYLLISFWHQKTSPADAGMSAFLFTKFGDIFLFASIGLLFYFTNSVDLQVLNHLAKNGDIDKNVLYVISIFILISAIGKSGQFPLFPWLMRAMEGPTTVSALIHGATMVNSGIYIIARLFDFYVAGEALIIVAIFGAISAFIGATSALVQSELKKVLAYSTMSHLSLAFVGLGAGSFVAGMGHLINHSVFKALLFLGSGAVIMSASHIKDMWRFGGLSKKMPLVAFAMGLGALSLSGIPPFSGFYSKDMIIATTLTNPQTYGLISTLTLVSGVLSVAYIGRLWFLTFAGEPRDKELYLKTKVPSFFWITLPLILMGIATFVMGFYQKSIAHYLVSKEIVEPEVPYLTFYLLGAIFFVGFIVYIYFVKRLDITQKISSQPLMKAIHKVLYNGYFVEFFIHYFIKNMLVGGVAKMVNFIDTYIVDKFINSSVDIARYIHTLALKTNTKNNSANALSMVLGILILSIVLFIWSVK